MESDVGQYSFSCLRVVSCLFAWFHVSSRLSAWFHVSSRGFMSLHGFMSSRRFDIFVLLSDLRVVFRSSHRPRVQRTAASSCRFDIFVLLQIFALFQIFASPSCPTDSGVFPEIFIPCPFILSMMNLTPVMRCHSRQYSAVLYFINWYLYP